MTLPGEQYTIRIDPAFLIAKDAASTHTGMDEFRLFQLWHFAAESAKLPAGELLEVGCAYGGSGLVIAASARRAGITDRITLCDTFRGLVKADPEKDDLQNGEMSGSTPEHVIRLLSDQGIQNAAVARGVFPEDTPFPDDIRFRFVHLDVDIYRSALDAFEWVWPRMVVGGIVVIDDYGEADCPGIAFVVGEVESLPDSTWFFHGGFQAIAMKR